MCAIGICACNGGVFKDCYNVIGGVDKAIPVDIYVPGCAERPQAIIDGVVKSLALLKEKSNKLKQGKTVEKEADKVVEEIPSIGFIHRGLELLAEKERLEFS